MTTDRARLVRRGLWLNGATLGLGLLEGGVGLVAGAVSHSVVLVGFGADSLIELASAGAAAWRLRSDTQAARRGRAERGGLRIIGGSFLLLALYVAVESVLTLARRQPSEPSRMGIAITALSVVTMPLLARAKRNVARGIDSRALAADATQTSLCGYLSAIALGGVVLRAGLGWWWTDPVAALVMVPIIFNEGIAGIRGKEGCGDDCC